MNLPTAFLSITNPADARLLSVFLMELGFRVETIFAKDLSEDPKIQADFIIADIKLGMAKKDFFIRLKKSSTVFLPILLLLPKNKTSELLLQSPFDDIIRIPITKIEFKARILAFMRLREQSALIVRQSEQKYRSFFENTGTATAIIEENLIVSQVNVQFEKLSGYTRQEIQWKKLWTEFVEPTDIERLKKYHHLRLSHKPAPDNYEFRFVNKQNEKKDILISASLIPNSKKTLASLIDITASKQAEKELRKSYEALEKSKLATLKTLKRLRTEIKEREKADKALRESEEKFRILSESTASAIFIYQGDKLIYVNPATEKLTKRTAKELLHMHIWDIIHPDHHSVVRERVLARQRGKNLEPNYEFKILQKDGTVRWISYSAGTVPYHGEKATIGTAVDITERKLAQAELKRNEENLHALAARLLKVREEERVAISRELHDYLGQGLTALKINLAEINKKTTSQHPKKNTALEKLQKSTGLLIDDLIFWVRKLSADLRPPILEDFGILTAIEVWANEFIVESQTKFLISAQVEDFTMKPDNSIAVYRIFQEMITNVIRHAKASIINVHIFEKESATILQVKDNGIGMDTAVVKGKHSLGVLGMHERAELFGGQLDIQSKPGEGTKVTLSIPNKYIIR